MVKLCKCGCDQEATFGDWVRGHWLFGNQHATKSENEAKWSKEKRRKHAEYMREWRRKNREHILIYKRQHHAKNKDHINELQRERWLKRKDLVNARIRQERKANPEKFRKYDRKRYRENPQKILAKNRRCLSRHRTEYLAKKREYNRNHREEMRQWRKQNLNHLVEYNRNRRGKCKPYQFARQDVCIICGLSNQASIIRWGRRLDVHHLDGDLMNNSEENLVTVCRGCHSKIEQIRPLIPVVE